ncbi:MAG: N-formylglutamate amidohydrolase [Bacteroidales bacterium]|nr:N-formylglutamate amidohydrolase [Bacteroidales bacterium]
MCEGALLLDCHSFPKDMGDVDVCIGFNEDWSKPSKELLEYAVNLFEDNSYSVGINYPYSNSEAPACPFTYQSMMLEVNKRVYLEQRSTYLKTHCDKKRSVREVVNQLLKTTTNNN